MTHITSPPGQQLDADSIFQALATTFERQYTGLKVLVLIPDHTRTIPLPLIFPYLVQLLHDTRQLDFMVALGTHPPQSEERLRRLVGISLEERQTIYRHIGILNHAWDSPGDLVQIGTLPAEQIKQIAGDHWHPSLGGDVAVKINRAIFDYDHILILGPTFPHEVVGFSGGAKYLFPGISGADMINVTHWLGALAGIRRTIGVKETPVRALINAAAEYVAKAITLIALVVEGKGLAGMFIGHYLSAWSAAADLSSERHVVRVDRAFQRVLSSAPPQYDELWTAAKAIYKLEPVVSEGGELIVYAPHLDVVSHVHGKHIYAIGYHVLPYFLGQWERFKDVPLGVLAHSTHVRGDGRYDSGTEYPRTKITLATQIPAEDCATLSLGYRSPEEIDAADWQGREDERILYVPRAGEILYRIGGRGEAHRSQASEM